MAVSLLDAVGGETLQSDLVMDPVYGRPGIFEGLKTRGPAASREAVDRPREHLLEACRRLRDELRCEVLIAACTEIPLALPGDHVEGLPLVDSLRILARDAILRVYDLDPNPVS